MMPSLNSLLALIPMNLILLNDIKVGHSKVGQIYVKHHDLQDEARLSNMVEFFLALTKKRKVPTEAERLEATGKDGTWTREDEKALNDTILMRNRVKLNYDSSMDAMKKYLKDDLEKFTARAEVLDKKRADAIGRTAESVSQRMANERFVASLLFKNAALTERFVSDEEIEYLEEGELNQIYHDFITYRDRTQDNSVRALAASSYCQNLFYIAGSCSELFGKSALDLTVLQQHLLMYIKSYGNIVSQIAGKVSGADLTNHEFLDRWSASSEKAREQMEGKKTGGPTYESIRKAAERKTSTLEEQAASMKSVLG